MRKLNKYEIARIKISQGDIINIDEMPGVLQVKSVIECGGRYFNKEVISSRDFWIAFHARFPDTKLSKNDKGQLLRLLGYKPHWRNPVRFDGLIRRFYTSSTIMNFQIKYKLLQYL